MLFVQPPTPPFSVVQVLGRYMIHEYHVDEFTTRLNSMDYNIKFITEPEQDGTLRFLDAWVNINEDGSTRHTLP